MAKKIRFSLEMEQGIEVRSLDELQENFSLAKISDYLSNGKLLTWLRDRYEDEIADKIESLDPADESYYKNICSIFNVEYNNHFIMDLEKAEELNRKLATLKQYTAEQKYLDVVNNVAFNQDDLYDLLDEDETTIYLCGNKFSIPLNKKGITYIGINNPKIIINSKEAVNWKEKKITLIDVGYDDKYKVVEYHKTVDNPAATTISNYSKNSFIHFMLSPNEKTEAENLYKNIQGTLGKITYKEDADIERIQKRIKEAGIVDLADIYLKNL